MMDLHEQYTPLLPAGCTCHARLHLSSSQHLSSRSSLRRSSLRSRFAPKSPAVSIRRSSLARRVRRAELLRRFHGRSILITALVAQSSVTSVVSAISVPVLVAVRQPNHLHQIMCPNAQAVAIRLHGKWCIAVRSFRPHQRRSARQGFS